LVEEKLNMSLHCALVAQKASGILDFNRGGVASRVRKMVVPHYSVLMKLQLK